MKDIRSTFVLVAIMAILFLIVIGVMSVNAAMTIGSVEILESDSSIMNGTELSGRIIISPDTYIMAIVNETPAVVNVTPPTGGGSGSGTPTNKTATKEDLVETGGFFTNQVTRTIIASFVLTILILGIMIFYANRKKKSKKITPPLKL